MGNALTFLAIKDLEYNEVDTGVILKSELRSKLALNQSRHEDKNAIKLFEPHVKLRGVSVLCI